MKLLIPTNMLLFPLWQVSGAHAPGAQVSLQSFREELKG